VIALVLTAGALAWVGVLLAAPAMPEAGAAWLDAVGGIICHQLPERSFAIDGRQLPVCGRCLGLYAGAAAGALVAWLPGGARGAGRDALSGAAARWTVDLAAVPTALTIALEWTGLWAGSSAWRCAAGVVLGGAAAVVVMRAVASPAHSTPARHGLLD
jgi:uncharacterized membrane protein